MNPSPASTSVGWELLRKRKRKRWQKKGSSTPALNEGRVASSARSVEEITHHHKNRKTSEKCKEKVGASVWADIKTALARANEIVSSEELKEISGVPSHEMVNRHVHKLVQVTFHCVPSPLVLSFFSFFFFLFFFFFFFNTKYINCSWCDFGC